MPNRVTRIMVTNVERIQNLLEKIEAVDLVGLSIFGFGEHPPSKYLDFAPPSSSPPVRRAPHSATGALIVGGPATIAEKIYHYDEPLAGSPGSTSRCPSLRYPKTS